MATSSTATPRPRPPADAIALLKADHEKVSPLFADFEKTRSVARRKAIVAEICQDLTVHTALEEEIFYPAVKAALKDRERVPEATVEHASVKDLIAQVKDVEPDGEVYDARVKVMGEFVKHHVKEEQNEMFPKAHKTRLYMVALRDQMLARKEELMASVHRLTRWRPRGRCLCGPSRPRTGQVSLGTHTVADVDAWCLT